MDNNIRKPISRVIIQMMRVFLLHPSQHREAALYWAGQMGADGQLNSSAWAKKDIKDWNVRPLLQNITAPTLAIWALKDRLLPVKQSNILVQEIASCRAVRIPECGHFPMIEAFEIYMREIERFFYSGPILYTHAGKDLSMRLHHDN